MPVVQNLMGRILGVLVRQLKWFRKLWPTVFAYNVPMWGVAGGALAAGWYLLVNWAVTDLFEAGVTLNSSWQDALTGAPSVVTVREILEKANYYFPVSTLFSSVRNNYARLFFKTKY